MQISLESIDPGIIRGYVRCELQTKVEQDITMIAQSLNVETLCRFFFELNQVCRKYIDPRDLSSLPLTKVEVPDTDLTRAIEIGQKEGVKVILTSDSLGARMWVIESNSQQLAAFGSFQEAREFCVQNGLKYSVFDPLFQIKELSRDELAEVEKYLA
jgi:hypothetical protein